MQDLNLGFFQMDIVWENPDANKNKIEKMILELPEKPHLLILPEMFLTGFSCDQLDSQKSNPELSINWLREISLKYKIAVMGSLKIFENLKFINRMYFCTPEGNVQHYDKRHLFVLSSEAKNFERGHDIKTFKLGEWKIFPEICYDLRFPVWSRNSCEYDILINVANWPSARSYAWKSLLVARAIENQAYVVGVNRVGKDGNAWEYGGESMVIDALGKVLLDAGYSEKYFSIKLSKNELLKTRESFPFLVDRDQFDLKDV